MVVKEMNVNDFLLCFYAKIFSPFRGTPDILFFRKPVFFAITGYCLHVRKPDASGMLRNGK